MAASIKTILVPTIPSKPAAATRIPFKQNLKKIKELFSKNTDQFCRNTTLHGLKYLTDEELYPRERCFFGLAFATVVFLALFFVLQVWEKWNTTPVIFGTNPEPTYITQEPFPAVTICNLNVAYKSRAEQFSIFSTEYAMLQLLCKREVNVTIADSISDWSNLNHFMTEIAQPCSNLMVSCRYGAIKYNCSELFQPVITDEGLCCVFNMVHPGFMYNIMKHRPLNESNNTGGFLPIRWTSESGYSKRKLPNKNYYPRPAAGVGETLGLSITLDAESDEYYCSSMNSVGFKISVHSPMESPSLREIGLLLSPGRETKVRIRAEKYESEQKLRSIHRRYRQCLFQDEEELIIFSHYSQRNCEMECVAKTLLAYCGCISYFMPRLHGNESICSIYESTCVERMRIASMLTEYNQTDCESRCLPSCYDVTYFPDFFSAPLKHYGFQIANQAVKNMSSNYVEQNIAVVHLYFKEYAYRSFKQTEFISGTDVLSSIGGLIGLFFGFSFISFAEFIFFAMIRPFRAARQIADLPENHSIQPAWKKPIRKRYKRELGFNDGSYVGSNPWSNGVPMGKLNIEQMYMSSEFLKQKTLNDVVNQWNRRKQFMV